MYNSVSQKSELSCILINQCQPSVECLSTRSGSTAGTWVWEHFITGTRTAFPCDCLEETSVDEAPGHGVTRVDHRGCPGPGRVKEAYLWVGCGPCCHLPGHGDHVSKGLHQTASCEPFGDSSLRVHAHGHSYVKASGALQEWLTRQDSPPNKYGLERLQLFLFLHF